MGVLERFWDVSPIKSIQSLVKENLDQLPDSITLLFRSNKRAFDAKKSWAAVVEWHGPFESAEECAEEADNFAKKSEESGTANFRQTDSAEQEDLANFGLYMVIGKYKSYSIAKKKILYIGMNEDEPQQSLSTEIKNRFRTDEKLKKCKGSFWFGIILAPRFKGQYVYTEIEESSQKLPPITEEARSTEWSLVYALNPLLNMNEFTAPKFSFTISNIIKPKEKNRAYKDLRARLPNLIEYNKRSDRLELSWNAANGLREYYYCASEIERENQQRRNETHSNFFAERFYDVVEQITTKDATFVGKRLFSQSKLIGLAIVGLLFVGWHLTSGLKVCEDDCVFECPADTCDAVKQMNAKLIAEIEDVNKGSKAVHDRYFPHTPLSDSQGDGDLTPTETVTTDLLTVSDTPAGRAALNGERSLLEVFNDLQECESSMGQCSIEKERLNKFIASQSSEIDDQDDQITQLQNEIAQLKMSKRSDVQEYQECINVESNRTICLIKFGEHVNIVEYGEIIRPIAPFPDKPQKAER